MINNKKRNIKKKDLPPILEGLKVPPFMGLFEMVKNSYIANQTKLLTNSTKILLKNWSVTSQVAQ